MQMTEGLENKNVGACVELPLDLEREREVTFLVSVSGRVGVAAGETLSQG